MLQTENMSDCERRIEKIENECIIEEHGKRITMSIAGEINTDS